MLCEQSIHCSGLLLFFSDRDLTYITYFILWAFLFHVFFKPSQMNFCGLFFQKNISQTFLCVVAAVSVLSFVLLWRRAVYIHPQKVIGQFIIHMLFVEVFLRYIMRFDLIGGLKRSRCVFLLYISLFPPHFTCNEPWPYTYRLLVMPELGTFSTKCTGLQFWRQTPSAVRKEVVIISEACH